MYDEIEIVIPDTEMWDPSKEEFVTFRGETIQLKHSLISLQKWESKWHKPFLGENNGPKTPEETIDYIKCMTISKVRDESVYTRIPDSEYKKVQNYINDPMTATWFNEKNRKRNNKRPARRTETVTAEVLYYDMIALGIPFECKKWHLNQLITLIRVCQEKNEKPQKVNKKDDAMQRRALNAERKAKMHTRG